MTYDEAERTPAQKKWHEKLTEFGDLWDREIKPDLITAVTVLAVIALFVVAVVAAGTAGVR